MQPAPHRLSKFVPTLLASLLMLAIVAYAHWLQEADPDQFYRIVQEDERLEWGTFWAFLLAAVANGVAALRQHRVEQGLPWFLIGLGLFCFVVAMEEISWAQRVLGYRPPSYFLEHNYQQEFNFHNVIESDLRQDAFIGLISAYGVVLPLLAAIPGIARLLAAARIVSPPALLAPAFAVALWIYVDYPWRFAAEIVELTVGFGFLCAGSLRAREFAEAPGPSVWRQTVLVLVLAGVTLGLGVASAAVSRFQRRASPEALRAAEIELDALKRDFYALPDQRDGRLSVRCNVHKRLYTFVEKYHKPSLLRGEFAALTSQGLPEERAAFFIDPWNDPYWIRSRCSKNRSRQSVFLYSFGPNRLRDSDKWEVHDDDVGVYLMRDGMDRLGFQDGGR